MRIRAIKPGLFTDVDIAQLPFEQRLLFIGLWCLADREGRLEDDPRTIKAALFSSDLSKLNKKVDIEKLLDGLCQKPFIIRYEVEGKKYIQVVNFKEHQQPHVKETESKIPAPSASTIQAPCKTGASTIQEPQEQEGKGTGREQEGNGIYVDFEKQVHQSWNQLCDKFPVLSKIQEITPQRRDKLKKRFERDSFREFGKIISAIEEQSFLIHGDPKSTEHKSWKVNFDWLIENDTNYVKVLERRYKDKNQVPEGIRKYLQEAPHAHPTNEKHIR